MAILDLGKVKLLWRGNWATGTAYEKDDVVYSNGSVWICTQNHNASTSGQGLNRLAPGKRFRQSGYGVTYDDEKPTVIYDVYKNGGKFYLNGRLNPNITIEKGHTYRFYVHDASMIGASFRFATSTDGTTYTSGVTTRGAGGENGAYVEITVPLDAPATLYYKQDGTPGVADTATTTVSAVWQGWQYWEELSRGLKWSGNWSNSTQYYTNDVVVYDGNMYYALCDNVGEIPDITSAHRAQYIEWIGQQTTQRNNFTWHLLAGNQHKRRHDLGMWLPNQGPVNWPYLHNDDVEPAVYRKFQYISSDGRIMGLGAGTAENNSGMNGGSGVTSYIQEHPFYFMEWWKSREAVNNDGGRLPRLEEGVMPGEGYNRLINRGGEVPKCIQIEMHHNSTYYLFDNGELWAIGYNGYGEQGIGTTGNRARPVRVQNFADRKIIKISCSKQYENSAHHLLALDDEGDVWTWGYNDYGQLGHGHNRYVYSPRRIPREWFGGEEIIDILAAGNEYGSSYVRTKSNFLYSWGYNAVGQLGVGDTTNRWKPTKVLSFNPVTNGGILKFAMSGSSSGSFHLLDGNGYMWHSGANNYGTALNASTSNNNTLARSTLAPTAGATVNFWASSPGGYNMIVMRTNNGNTYFAGYNGGYYHSGIGNQTTPQSSPTLVPNITNVKRVCFRGTYSNYIRSYWLTDQGRLFNQGYSNYSAHGNEYGSNSLIQNGTNYYVTSMPIPAGTKILDMWVSCSDEGTSAAGSSNYFLCDNGQIYGNGYSGRGNSINNCMMGNHSGAWNAGIIYPFQISKGYCN
jgi:alpha-tubulin suppressor-like RCC1 family protein